MQTTLPKKGDKIYAWVPKLHKEVAATVEAVRGSKLTVAVYTGDNGLEKFSGIERWKPAEKNGKLKGEQLPLPDPIIEIIETSATVEEPPKNFDPKQETIKIADIWPKAQDFLQETEEAIKLQPRYRIDPDTVDRYAEIFDVLPAIDVFQIEGKEGYCLAGGWHRREAALQLGKEEIKANIHTGSFEEAVIFAATDNLTSGLQLGKREVEAACKTFLRVCENLPAYKISEIVAEVNRKFNKKATELSNVVIGLMFGISDRTIANYKKDLEVEKRLAQFSKGDRVEISESKLKDHPVEYRRGTVDEIWRHRILIKPDCTERVPMQYCNIDEIERTDAPAAEITIHKNLTPGDRIKHWKYDEVGIVVATNWENPDCIWGYNTISRKEPMIMFADRLTTDKAIYFDVVEAGTPPSLEECLEVAKKQLEALDADESYTREKMEARVKFLENLIAPAQPTTEPTPAATTAPVELKTYTNAEAEVKAKGKQLGLNGNGSQQLPSVEHKEDPTITGDTLPAAVATTARKDSLLNEVLEMIDEVWPDEKEALKLLEKLLPHLPEKLKNIIKGNLDQD